MMEFNNFKMGSVNFNASFNGQNTARQTPMAATPRHMNNMGQQQYATTAVPADDSINFRFDSYHNNNNNFGTPGLDSNFNFSMAPLDNMAFNSTFEQNEIARLNNELIQQKARYNTMIQLANTRYQSLKLKTQKEYNGVVEHAKIAFEKGRAETATLQRHCARLSAELRKAVNQINKDRAGFHRYMSEQRANTTGVQAAQPPQQQQRQPQRQDEPIVIDESVGDDEPILIPASPKLAPQAATGEQPTPTSLSKASPEASAREESPAKPARDPQNRRKWWAFEDMEGGVRGALYGHGTVMEGQTFRKQDEERKIAKEMRDGEATRALMQEQRDKASASKKRKASDVERPVTQPKKKQKQKKSAKNAPKGDPAELLRQEEELLRVPEGLKAAAEKTRQEVEAAEKKRQQNLEAKEGEGAAAAAAASEELDDAEVDSDSSPSQEPSEWSQEFEDEFLAGIEMGEGEEEGVHNTGQAGAEGGSAEQLTAAEQEVDFLYDDEEEAEPDPFVVVDGNRDGIVLDDGMEDEQGIWGERFKHANDDLFDFNAV